MKKNKIWLIIASAIAVAPLTSCLYMLDQNTYFNTGYFKAGAFYFESMEGTCTSEDIKFDGTSYLVATPLSGQEEAKTYEEMIEKDTPNGLWDVDAGMSEEGEYLYMKLEWFNCYFADMPSLDSIGGSADGKIFKAIDEKTVDGETVRNEWYYDYQELFDSGKIKTGIFAFVELHKENDVLTECRISFEIPDVCDLVMYFSFVAAS